jgi:hypothetical protein
MHNNENLYLEALCMIVRDRRGDESYLEYMAYLNRREDVGWKVMAGAGAAFVGFVMLGGCL